MRAPRRDGDRQFAGKSLLGLGLTVCPNRTRIPSIPRGCHHSSQAQLNSRSEVHI
jgi:hypothetical protein